MEVEIFLATVVISASLVDDFALEISASTSLPPSLPFVHRMEDRHWETFTILPGNL
jgi:hypothetical protein